MSLRLVAPLLTRLLPLAAILLAPGCRDFSLADPEEMPRIDALSAPYDPPAGYWRDLVVVEGGGLGADVTARFEPEGIGAEILESAPARLVVEVPDLGDGDPDKTLRFFSQRTGAEPFVEYAFDYRGPGQARNGRVSETRSLNPPVTDIRRVYVPPAYRGDAELQELAGQIVFAYTSGPSALADYLLPINLKANLALSSIELERPILDAAILAAPNGSDDYPYVASVITLTEDGKMHVHGVGFEKLAEDLGWVTSLAFGGNEEPLPTEMSELVVRYVDSSRPGDLTAMVVAGRFDESGYVSWRGTKPDGSASRVEELAGVATSAPLGVVTTDARVFVTGIADKAGALARELVLPAVGAARLDPIRLADGRSLESALAYALNDVLFPGDLAASPDDERLALTFYEYVSREKITLPRVALLSRDAGGALHLAASAAGGFYFPMIAFARREGQNVLYAIDEPSAALVRLNPATLLPAAAFPLPGEQSRPSSLSTDSSGERLLVGLEDGDLYQFDSASETFAVRTSFDKRAGQVLAFELERQPAVVVLGSTGDPSPGRVSLIRPKEPSLFFGGVSWDIPVFGSGAFLSSGTGQGAGRALNLFASTALYDETGVQLGARTTVIAAGARPKTQECTTTRVAFDLATHVDEPTGYALAIEPPAYDQILLVPFSTHAGDRDGLCAALGTTPARWSAPLAGTRAVVGRDERVLIRVCDSLRCESSRLVYLRGQTPLGEVQLGDLAGGDDDLTEPLPLAVDGRGCSPGFKPAAYAALEGGIAVVQLEGFDAAGRCLAPQTISGEAPLPCRRRSEDEQALAVDAHCLQVGRIVALAPSPNGRKLYVLANREANRWLVEVEVERNAVGAVVGLGARGEVALGTVSDPSAGGLSVYPDGTSVFATAGDALIYYE